jgi:hypothetical protein
MLHAYLAAGFSRKECRGKSNVANVATGELELARKKTEIDVVGKRRGRGMLRRKLVARMTIPSYSSIFWRR